MAFPRAWHFSAEFDLSSNWFTELLTFHDIKLFNLKALFRRLTVVKPFDATKKVYLNDLVNAHKKCTSTCYKHTLVA